MIYIIIYFVFFFSVPIIAVYLDKQYIGSVGFNKQSDTDRITAFIMIAIFWLPAIFYLYFTSLNYWYLKK